MNTKTEFAFGMTIDGRNNVSLSTDYDRTLIRPLHRLGPEGPDALAVWWYPAKYHFVDVPRSEYGHWYLQCAGTADAMTIELREPTATPGEWLKFNQWVIGKGPVDTIDKPDVEITWADHTEYLYEPEVFTADEAAAAFLEYVQSRTLSDRWHRRLIDSGE